MAAQYVANLRIASAAAKGELAAALVPDVRETTGTAPALS
jgi:hypothetical protein